MMYFNSYSLSAILDDPERTGAELSNFAAVPFGTYFDMRLIRIFKALTTERVMVSIFELNTVLLQTHGKCF